MTVSTIYEERIWLNSWVSLLMGILIGSFSIIGLVQYYYGISIGRRPGSPVVYIGLALLFAFTYLNFNKLDIDITKERIEVRYGLVKKVIPLKEIASYEPHIAGLHLYGGIGIRRGVDGSLAFTTSFGNSMKIHMRSGRPFVFSTNKPYEIVKTLSSFIDGVQCVRPPTDGWVEKIAEALAISLMEMVVEVKGTQAYSRRRKDK